MMKNAVELKDREEHVENLKMALLCCGIRVGYVQAELINDVVDKVRELGQEFSLKDAAKLFSEHKKKWDFYFELLNE